MTLALSTIASTYERDGFVFPYDVMTVFMTTPMVDDGVKHP